MTTTVNIPEFKVRRNMRGDLSAQNYITVNGKDWQISTSKRYSGLIVCTAQQGVKDGDVFTFMMFESKSLTLATSNKRATEKEVAKVHAHGLQNFAKQVGEADQTEDTPFAAPYQIKVGQIFFLNGYGQDEYHHEKKVIFDLGEGKRPMYQYLNLETGRTGRTEGYLIRNIKEKFGIGSYYKEGEIFEDTEKLMELVAQAQKMEKIEAEIKAEREEAAAKERAEKIAKGKTLVSVPEWAQSVIVGVYNEDESDSMTDYFGHKKVKTVFLAWSKHKRDIFSEMRKAAANCPDTYHLSLPDSEEHREKYSMGHGYYLGKSYNRTGWKVEKDTYNKLDRDELYIAAAEGRCFFPDNAENEPQEPQTKESSTTPGEAKESNLNGVIFAQYSERAGVVYGETKKYKDILGKNGLRCRFNFALNIEGKKTAGWIFPISRMEEVRNAIENF